MFKIKENPPKGLTETEKWSEEFNNFVKKCLEVDPVKRADCEQLLREKFIGQK